MRKISHVETIEYIYETEEERLEHIKTMLANGWEVNKHKQMRLKVDANIMTATDDDYDWYAVFWKKF